MPVHGAPPYPVWLYTARGHTHTHTQLETRLNYRAEAQVIPPSLCALICGCPDWGLVEHCP
eukprot:1477589-Prymnesium_polylepis.1